MTDITIRDLIIHYTAKSAAYQFASTCVNNPTNNQKLLEMAERYSDEAFKLSEIRLHIGKSATTEMNILDNYMAREKKFKQKFKEKYGVPVEG